MPQTSTDIPESPAPFTPDDLALAARLVRSAGELAARMLADGLTVQLKTSVSDVVSAADHEAERLIADGLRAARPKDAVVGEEGTTTAREDGHPADRTWYVDPVDGTYNFLSGLPEWCSAVALVGTSGAALGAVYQHSTGELWTGGPGMAAACNGVEVAPLVEAPLSQVSLATYLHPATLPDRTRREPLLRVLHASATVRMLGSGSVELAAVSAGRLGASVQADSLPWDWYPGAALVLAAGGAATVVPAHGHDWHIAGNRRAVAEIAELLQAD